MIPAKDIERRNEVRVAIVTGHQLKIFGTTRLFLRTHQCRDKVEFEAYVCENETTEPTQINLGGDFLDKNRVQLRYGPKPVMRLWGQTVYFHSRREIERDVWGVEMTNRKCYWRTQVEKAPRKSPGLEKRERETKT
ncbi:hypothetical protein JTB14_024355 [Gonioctena quinquepunctata]|nr:hypothetical protein JTB14_024355 [Gonioctena quinquepunctata]